MVIFSALDGNEYYIRKLESTDAEMLAAYFEKLSDLTKARFGPHPLTTEFAAQLCEKHDDTADRFVILPKTTDLIVGYFILEFKMPPHEKRRYLSQEIVLEEGKDILFAPSMADDFQNCGIASQAMPVIVEHCRQKGARSLVLMGGTQATNGRAIAFYEKYGFNRFGGYQTEVFNHDMRLMF